MKLNSCSIFSEQNWEKVEDVEIIAGLKEKLGVEPNAEINFYYPPEDIPFSINFITECTNFFICYDQKNRRRIIFDDYFFKAFFIGLDKKPENS